MSYTTGSRDHENIADTLIRVFRPEGLSEDRPLHLASFGGSAMHGEFSDRDRLAETLGQYAGKRNLYVIPNAHEPVEVPAGNTLGGTKGVRDEQVTARRWLLVDFDVKPAKDFRGPNGQEKRLASEQETNLARARALDVAGFLGGHGFAEPLHARSGNGWHLLYQLEGGGADQSGADPYRGVLRLLDERFSDDVIQVDRSTYNAARFTKAYGCPVVGQEADGSRGQRPSFLLPEPAGHGPVSESAIRGLLEWSQASGRPTSGATPSSAAASQGSREFLDALRAEGGTRLIGLFSHFGHTGEVQHEGAQGDERVTGNGGLTTNPQLGLWHWFSRDAGGDAIDAWGFCAANSRGEEWDKQSFRLDGRQFAAATQGLAEWLREQGASLPPEPSPRLMRTPGEPATREALAQPISQIPQATTLAELAPLVKKVLGAKPGEAGHIALRDALVEWFVVHGRVVVDSGERADHEAAYVVDDAGSILNLGDSGTDAQQWQALTMLGYAYGTPSIKTLRSELLRRGLESGQRLPLQRWSCVRERDGAKWLYVSNGARHLVRVAPDGNMELLRNGTDGVYFVTPQVLQAWQHLASPVALTSVRAFAPALQPDHLMTAYDAEAQMALTEGFVLGRLVSIGTMPMLVCQGGPGTGKTTLATAIATVFEGHDALANRVPNSGSDFQVNAADSSIYVIDNLEEVAPSWLLDLMSKYTTDRTFKERRFYTNKGRSITRGFANVIVTSISNTFLRQDIGQRTIPIMHTEPEEMRDPDEIRDEVLRNRDGLLVGLCQAAVRALNALPSSTRVKTRFAGFASLVTGYLETTGRGELAVRALGGWQSVVSRQAIQGEPVVEAIVHYVEKPLAGKSAEVLRQLQVLAPEVTALKSLRPEAFARALQRLAVVLAAHGYDVIVAFDRHAKTNRYEIIPPTE